MEKKKRKANEKRRKKGDDGKESKWIMRKRKRMEEGEGIRKEVGKGRQISEVAVHTQQTQPSARLCLTSSSFVPRHLHLQ